MRGNLHVVFVRDEDLENIGRTWQTAGVTIAASIAIAALSIGLGLVFTPKPGRAWLFYGGQSLVAGVNLARAAYVAWRQARIEKKKRSRN